VVRLRIDLSGFWLHCVGDWSLKFLCGGGDAFVTKHRRFERCEMILQEPFLTKVVNICDGDTITVAAWGQKVRIRIAWIDAPEDGQPGSREAREELKGLILDGLVKVQIMEADCYGRYISRVWTEEGKEINEAMLASGWAVYYAPKFRSEYHQRVEREARERRVGVWGFHGFQMPKAFRQAKRRRR